MVVIEISPLSRAYCEFIINNTLDLLWTHFTTFRAILSINILYLSRTFLVAEIRTNQISLHFTDIAAREYLSLRRLFLWMEVQSEFLALRSACVGVNTHSDSNLTPKLSGGRGLMGKKG